ncbi:MAG: hypothetical protein JNK04_02445, partial [Myxococcales bacterium]|nr:hypothetical protein [Myxococcales bacterium]
MLNLKSISETLSLLTGAALLAACGSSQAPVNATEVPAEPDAKQAAPATTETTGEDAASAAKEAEPSGDAPTAAASAAPSTSAVASAAPVPSVKKPVP